jgi:hypothetical protein
MTPSVGGNGGLLNNTFSHENHDFLSNNFIIESAHVKHNYGLNNLENHKNEVAFE